MILILHIRHKLNGSGEVVFNVDRWQTADPQLNGIIDWFVKDPTTCFIFVCAFVIRFACRHTFHIDGVSRRPLLLFIQFVHKDLQPTKKH